MKKYINKKMILAVGTVLILVVAMNGLQSCTNQNENDLVNSKLKTNKINLAPKIKRSWKEQLAYIKNTKIPVLESNDIELLDYSAAYSIDESSVEQIKDDFKRIDIIVPCQISGSDSIKFCKITDINNINNHTVKFNIDEHKKFIDKIITSNISIVDIKWRIGTNFITTKCLVSEKDGIIFDYFLSNIWIATENSIVNNDTIKITKNSIQKIKRFKVDSTEGTAPIITYTINKTWTSRYNSQSLSGYSGSATVNHGVQYESKVQGGITLSKKILFPHNCSASAVLSDGGTAAAGITEGSFDNNHANFYYGFWWAVNGSVTMTFSSSGGYSFTSTVSFSGQEVHSGTYNVLLSDL